MASFLLPIAGAWMSFMLLIFTVCAAISMAAVHTMAEEVHGDKERKK